MLCLEAKMMCVYAPGIIETTLVVVSRRCANVRKPSDMMSPWVSVVVAMVCVEAEMV